MALTRTWDSVEFIDPYRRRHPVPIRIGQHCEVVDRRILHIYLPNLRAYCRNLNFNGNIDLNHLIHSSGFFQSGRIHPRSMEQTLHILINSLSRNFEESYTTNLELITYLEQTFHESQSPPYPNYHRFGSTFQIFACLSLLAETFDSQRLRKTMVHFFSRYGTKIAKYEDSPEALLDWSREIHRSIHNPEDVIECFRQIVLYRPDFVRTMERIAMQHSSSASWEIYESINRVATALASTGIVAMIRGRGRGFPRRDSMMIPRRVAPSTFGVRARRPGWSRTYSGTMVRGRAGNPTRAIRQDRRKINNLEQRLARVEHAVGIIQRWDVLGDMRDIDECDDDWDWSSDSGSDFTV